jgi:hypothetical protein
MARWSGVRLSGDQVVRWSGGQVSGGQMVRCQLGGQEVIQENG